ncbi:methyltransferase-domain-containing protein [Terfezia claveryi]|nr:methyltransferase-domain-containing protein [Terfezia claveryi]
MEKKAGKKDKVQNKTEEEKEKAVIVGAVDKGPKVTDENLQTLYEKVVEGKKVGGGEGSGKKKRKRGKKGGKGAADGENPSSEEHQKQKDQPITSEPSRKKQKKDNKRATPQSLDAIISSAAIPISTTSPLASIPALTPLQQKMRAKLTGARFRHLNEALYTAPSATSFELFRSQPSMFHDYHVGFRQQVQSWPENPVDIFLKQLLSRASAKATPKDPKKNPVKVGGRKREQIKPLPRPPPTYTCTIADLGCGDAKLAATLIPISEKRNLNLKIHSFDLTSDRNPLVTEADIANLPLEKESVDITIFCLALMGTNYLNFIEEAFRVLRFGGELWIAEIKSRFTTSGSGGSTETPAPPPVSSAAEMGNKGKIGVLKKSQKPGDVPPISGDLDDYDLNDGEEEYEQQPTGPIDPIYTPFITALSRRGFVLKTDAAGNPGVDDRNKMFVRMEFLKPRPRVERRKPGEGDPDYDLSKEGRGGRGSMGRAGREGMKRERGKWLAETEEDVRRREERLLKPCVYKLR